MNGHGFDAQVVRDFFISQEEVFSRLYGMHKHETLGTYIESLPGLREAFALDDRCFRCMDERTPGGLHAAGPLILMGENEGIEMLKRSRADGIYSHTGCGAAGIAFESLDEKMRRFYVRPDEYGRFYAKAIAKRAGIRYMGHLEVAPSFHVARMAVYDGSGSFDNSKNGAIGLPPAFVISRRWHSDPAAAMREASIAAAIATGDHGFGRLIRTDRPFLLLVVGARHNKEYSLDKMAKEAEEVAKEFHGRVIVDGFVAPA